jgi:hypothetical protein
VASYAGCRAGVCAAMVGMAAFRSRFCLSDAASGVGLSKAGPGRRFAGRGGAVVLHGFGDDGFDLGFLGRGCWQIRIRLAGRRVRRGSDFLRAAAEHHGALAFVGAAVQGVGAAEGLELLGQRHGFPDDAAEQGKGRHGEGDGAGGVDAVGPGLRAVGVNGAVGHFPGEVGIDRAAFKQVDEVTGGDEPEAEAGVDGEAFGGWVRHGWATFG